MKGTKDVDRSRASGQDTRRRILAAAGELFSARGYEDVTIRDIAAAADADPALVIRYFTSKNDLFVLVRQPDLELIPVPGQPLTAQDVTRALVDLSLAQGTRLFDVTAVGRPEATELLRDQMETKLVRPLMDAFGLAPAGRVHIEAIAALVVGAGFMRHRMEAPGLRPLDAGQLTELLWAPYAVDLGLEDLVRRGRGARAGGARAVQGGRARGGGPRRGRGP